MVNLTKNACIDRGGCRSTTPRRSADWSGAQEKDAARRAAVEARWVMEEEARQAESRHAYEASLRR